MEELEGVESLMMRIQSDKIPKEENLSKKIRKTSK
jgi:hypothetical protein